MDEKFKDTNDGRWTARTATACALVSLFYGFVKVSPSVATVRDSDCYTGAAIICAAPSLAILGAVRR